MFAPSRNKPKQQQPSKTDKKPPTRKPAQPTVFKNNRLAGLNKDIIMNKQSSIRTFQPFVCCPSSSGQNSLQRSLMGSEENYQKFINEGEEQAK